MNTPASGAVPRGWDIDHHSPSDFVVRCTSCGRIAIKDDRAAAHKRADNHALRCQPTGVTPVSRPDNAARPDPTETEDTAVADGGLDALDSDISGEEIVVRYDSVSETAGGQKIIGDIVTMVPATDAEPFEYRGFILRLQSRARRRINLLEQTVECPHNSDDGWRRIGELTTVAPAYRAENEPVAMTDGGEAVEHAEQDDLTGYRAVCESCEWRGGLFRESEARTKTDRTIHNDSNHEGAPVATIEEFPARRNAAGKLLEVRDGE